MKDFEVAFREAAWKFDRAALATGATIVLPDGSSLLVRSVRRRWWSVGFRDELHIERDGVPVPGSDGDPRVLGRRAGAIIIFFGLLRVGLAALWLLFQRGGASRAFDLIAVEGVVLVVLGILAAFGRRLPVALAAGVFALEMVLALVNSPAVQNPAGLLIQVLVIVHLVLAWRRMAPRQRQPSLAQVFE